MSNIKGREGSRRSVSFPVSADGSFHADMVEPGDYTVEGDINSDVEKVACLIRFQYTFQMIRLTRQM